MKPVFIAILLGSLSASAAAAQKAGTGAHKPALPAPPLVVPPATPPASTPPAPGPGESDTNAALPPPSSAAQQLYSSARADLLQIRMLLKNGRSQSTVGSGFLIGDSNLVLTNYHVVS